MKMPLIAGAALVAAGLTFTPKFIARHRHQLLSVGGY